MPLPDSKRLQEMTARLRALGFTEDQARALAPGLAGHTCVGCPALVIGLGGAGGVQSSPAGRPVFGNTPQLHGLFTSCRCMPGDVPGTYRTAWGRCPLYGLESVEKLVQRQDELEQRLTCMERMQGTSLPSIQCTRIVAEAGTGDPED